MSPSQTGTGGSPESSEKFVIKAGTSSVSDVSSGNVLFVADGSGSGFVRSWMNGMVSAKAKEIEDTNVQLTTAKVQNISQSLLSTVFHR